MWDANQSLDFAVGALLAQPSCVSNSLVCVPDSLIVIYDVELIPSVPALIENTLGRTH